MLVLSGPQGIGKSTLFAQLGGKWFNDSLSMNDAKDKTAAEKLQGYWILEIGELAGIKKAEVEAVKSFLSRQRDIYRPAFGRRTVEHPRQCIIVGSHLTVIWDSCGDSTGNRTFLAWWRYGTTPDKAPWALNRYTIDQIWAEAMECFKAGEQLFLSGDVAKEALEQQKLAMETDERLGLIREYLDRLLPDDWEEKSLSERRSFIHGSEFGDFRIFGTRSVCVAEIWSELFCKDLVHAKV